MFRCSFDASDLIQYRDMTNISVGWDVEGVMSAQESVQSMLRVISTLSIKDTGKFLTWEGKVRK